MIVNKLSQHLLLQTRILMKFSGGHHEPVYDWRDDLTKNPDFYDDPRAIGVRDANTYTTPYSTDKKLEWGYSHPAEYNQKDLATNMVTSTNFGVIQNLVDVLSVPICVATYHQLPGRCGPRVRLRELRPRLPARILRDSAFPKTGPNLDVGNLRLLSFMVLR